MLRMVAGLNEPSAGEILIDDRNMSGLRPYERPIAMVFQSLALFPHMDVFSNIAYHEGERLAEFKSMTEKMIELLEKNR